MVLGGVVDGRWDELHHVLGGLGGSGDGLPLGDDWFGIGLGKNFRVEVACLLFNALWGWFENHLVADMRKY